MAVFLLKSSACLAVFLLFYKLLLENERMHTFKRYYLLVALVLALVIPSITFVEYVEVTLAPTSVISPVETITTETTIPIAAETGEPQITKTTINYWLIILWSVYGLGVLLFALKFLYNLRKIVGNVRNHHKVRIGSLIHVLMQDVIVPHTFFNYIFLNQKRFEANEIPKDVLVHEGTHARQKHSLDVLFVELLQIVFWLNPLLYLIKKSIKLNHEFLADQAVLNQGASAPHYQNTLLVFASSAEYKSNQPSMANAINYSSYSSIKKRFKIMKTHTSKKSILIRSILLLPLLAILFYSFTETKTIQIKGANTDGTNTIDASFFKTDKVNQNLNAKETSNRSVELAGLILDSETLLPLENVEIYDANGTLLSKTDDKGYYKVQFDKLGTGEIRFEFSLGKEGYKLLKQKEHWGDLRGKIALTYYFGLQKEKSGFPEFSELHMNIKNLSYESIQNNLYLVKRDFEFNKKVTAAKKDNQNVLITIDNAYYIVNETGLIKINSVDDMISINDEQIVSASKINGLIERKEITGMTPLDINSAQFAIYTIPIDNLVRPLNGATKEQLSKYNSLAKKYNAIPKKKRTIPSKDLKNLELIYRKMSENQKANALPFPECPDPKSSNQEGATTKQISEYNSLAKTYNTMLSNNGNIRIMKSDVNRLEYLYGLMTESQRADTEAFPDFPEPPEPPMPPTKPKFGRQIDQLNKQSEEMEQHSATMHEQAKKIEQQVMQLQKQSFKMEEQREIIEQKAREIVKEERAIQEIIENQEIIAEERPLITTPAWHLTMVEEAEIYSEGKEITYAEMKKMEREGTITSMNIIKKPNGNSIIKLNETNLRPPTPPKPKSPLELLEELKEENVKIILNGEEIDYEQAETLFEENTFSRVNVRKEKRERPVLEVSTD